MPITLKNISYTYMKKTPYEHRAVDNVSFEINEGDYISIVGHTGSGKSTLVQIMTGLIKDYEGTVLIDGVDYSEKKANKQELRKYVGVVFQYPEYQLFEESVEKDIAFGPKKQGLGEEEVAERVREAMELIELDYDTFKDKSPFSLSGGQKRKVAIAGVLAMKPKYLVLDEPIAGLDPVSRENFMQLTKKLNDNGVTIIIVSHNMDNIAEYASRIVILKDGAMYADGIPSEVLTSKEVIDNTFLDYPTVVKFANYLREKGIDIPKNIIRYDELKNYLVERIGGKN